MPDLPTISPTQAQFDRIVAAFPGATNAEKVAAYKSWLTNRLIDHVLHVESQKASDAAISSLPTRQSEPDFGFG